MNHLPEKKESLWLLTLSPAIWVVHFLLSYLSAAIWCARVVGLGGSLAPIRIAIAVYTAVALIGIGIVGWIGFRKHHFEATTVPYDFDTPDARHGFLGFSTVLLSALSAVATLYVALTAVFIETCH